MQDEIKNDPMEQNAQYLMVLQKYLVNISNFLVVCQGIENKCSFGVYKKIIMSSTSLNIFHSPLKAEFNGAIIKTNKRELFDNVDSK